MSKVCGIYRFDARPPSSEDQARVRTALDSSGCFTPQMCQQPGLVMGQAAGADAPQSQGLFQGLFQGMFQGLFQGMVQGLVAGSPPGTEQGPERIICSWDGRIDNRKDLLRHTGLGPDCPDAAIIHSLYREKGVDGLSGVVGDWSVVIWDANRREIVLASDYAGIRPLYYYRSADGVCWSSSLADLVRWTGVAQLDESYAAALLIRGKASGHTPYAGILPVPPGHAVSIARDRVVRRAFWTLPMHRETVYKDERHYEERLLELFREAVQARLAIGAPTCAELSGGLDSSSIVCMADRLRREASGGEPGLVTFSYTHQNSPDEKFYREVERVCQVSACHLDLQDCPAVLADRMGAVPSLWEPRFLELGRRMAEMGSAVLLTGQIGDFVMGNTDDDLGQVTEFLAKRRLGQAVLEAYAWGRAMQVPIYPILWQSVRGAWFSWAPPVDPNAAVGAMPASAEDSLVDGLRARLRSDERELAGEFPRDIPPGRRVRFRTAAEILQSRTLQVPEALQHISYTHPYAHRPLVEFMLTIPAHIVVGPGQPRRLMRRAFAGLLPPMVLARKSKAAYTSTYRESLMPLAKAMLAAPGGIRLVECGYVDRRSLLSRLEKFTQGLDCNETQLRQIVLLEFWLRHRMPVPRPSQPAASPQMATF